MREQLTEKFLRDHYIGEMKTLATISIETGWAIGTICKYLRKFGISKKAQGCRLPRSPGSRRMTMDFLVEQYVDGRKTTYRIAEENGVSASVVQYRLKQLNIPVRGNEDYADDLSGKEFGLLTVSSETKLKTVWGKNRTFYLCKCKCGGEKWIRRDRLAYGSNLSCGCQELENRRLIGERSWTGHREMTGSYWCAMVCRARRVNREFTISMEYAWKLFEEQNRKCKLTGYDIQMPSRSTKKRKLAGDGIRYASLDRIDSSKGYIEGNVQWVWSIVNMMKWTLSQDGFIAICTKVASHA